MTEACNADEAWDEGTQAYYNDLPRRPPAAYPTVMRAAWFSGYDDAASELPGYLSADDERVAREKGWT